MKVKGYSRRRSRNGHSFVDDVLQERVTEYISECDGMINDGGGELFDFILEMPSDCLATFAVSSVTLALNRLRSGWHDMSGHISRAHRLPSMFLSKPRSTENVTTFGISYVRHLSEKDVYQIRRQRHKCCPAHTTSKLAHRSSQAMVKGELCKVIDETPVLVIVVIVPATVGYRTNEWSESCTSKHEDFRSSQGEINSLITKTYRQRETRRSKTQETQIFSSCCRESQRNVKRDLWKKLEKLSKDELIQISPRCGGCSKALSSNLCVPTEEENTADGGRLKQQQDTPDRPDLVMEVGEFSKPEVIQKLHYFQDQSLDLQTLLSDGSNAEPEAKLLDCSLLTHCCAQNNNTSGPLASSGCPQEVDPENPTNKGRNCFVSISGWTFRHLPSAMVNGWYSFGSTGCCFREEDIPCKPTETVKKRGLDPSYGLDINHQIDGLHYYVLNHGLDINLLKYGSEITLWKECLYIHIQKHGCGRCCSRLLSCCSVRVSSACWVRYLVSNIFMTYLSPGLTLDVIVYQFLGVFRDGRSDLLSASDMGESRVKQIHSPAQSSLPSWGTIKSNFRTGYSSWQNVPQSQNNKYNFRTGYSSWQNAPQSQNNKYNCMWNMLTMSRGTCQWLSFTNKCIDTKETKENAAIAPRLDQSSRVIVFLVEMIDYVSLYSSITNTYRSITYLTGELDQNNNSNDEESPGDFDDLDSISSRTAQEHLVMENIESDFMSPPIVLCATGHVYRLHGAASIEQQRYDSGLLYSTISHYLDCLDAKDTNHLDSTDILDTNHLDNTDILDTNHLGNTDILDTNHLGNTDIMDSSPTYLLANVMQNAGLLEKDIETFLSSDVWLESFIFRNKISRHLSADSMEADDYFDFVCDDEDSLLDVRMDNNELYDDNFDSAYRRPLTTQPRVEKTTGWRTPSGSAKERNTQLLVQDSNPGIGSPLKGANPLIYTSPSELEQSSSSAVIAKRSSCPHRGSQILSGFVGEGHFLEFMDPVSSIQSIVTADKSSLLDSQSQQVLPISEQLHNPIDDSSRLVEYLSEYTYQDLQNIIEALELGPPTEDDLNNTVCSLMELDSDDLVETSERHACVAPAGSSLHHSHQTELEGGTSDRPQLETSSVGGKSSISPMIPSTSSRQEVGRTTRSQIKRNKATADSSLEHSLIEKKSRVSSSLTDAANPGHHVVSGQRREHCRHQQQRTRRYYLRDGMTISKLSRNRRYYLR